MRRHNFDPLLDELQLSRRLSDLVLAALAEEKIELVGLLQLEEVFKEHARKARQAVDEARIDMLLEDVAGNDQEQDVEVVRLVVPELNQAVVGQ